MHPVNIDETPLPGERPQPYVLRLARSKAQAAMQIAAAGRVVVAADTIVADGDDLLGKPADAAQAGEMLRRLRGRTHQVYTAIAAGFAPDGILFSDLCASQVPMRCYSEDEMAAYIASGDPLDKAGAYAIQNQAFQPVENFAGCYASVMGLPLCHLARLLTRLGGVVPPHVPHICQQKLEYACPLWREIN